MRVFIIAVIITFSIANYLVLTMPVRAAVSSCSVSVSPESVDSGSSADFSFTITNNDIDNSILWVKITRPSSNFTITGTSSAGGTVTSSDVTFSGAFSVGPSGGNISLSTIATAGSFGASSANWTVQASDDPSGASPATCSGDLGTSITGPSAITISGIIVSDVTDTSAKITWTTDSNAGSTINYGTTSSYGSTKSGTSLTTSHSLSLDSLSANTTYHYKVSSSNSDGLAQSGDRVFNTAKAGLNTVSTVTVINTVTKEVAAAPTSTPTSSRVSTELPPARFKGLGQIYGLITRNSATDSSDFDQDQSVLGATDYKPSSTVVGILLAIFSALVISFGIITWKFLQR